MNERISIKGQGASIFFEDGDEENEPTVSPEGDSSVAGTLAPGGQAIEASRHPGTAAPRRRPGNQQAGPDPGAGDEQELFKRMVLPPSHTKKLRALSREQHPYHTSVRITKAEQDGLKALAFELTQQLQRPVTVNDIARVALRLLVSLTKPRVRTSCLSP